MKTKRVRPILVESKVSTLHISHGKLLTRSIKPTSKSDLYKSIPQELILISLEDEEIKVGEIGLDLRDNTLFEVKRILTNHYESGILSFQKSYCKKVIAHQSQISPEYISKFIEQYNKDCIEDLDIEMENKISIDGHTVIGIEPKITNGFVTIVEKEAVLYTENDMRDAFEAGHKLGWSGYPNTDNWTQPKFEEWFNENKKK